MIFTLHKFKEQDSFSFLADAAGEQDAGFLHVREKLQEALYQLLLLWSQLIPF